MIALDTNVLVYAFDHGTPAKQVVATELIRETREGILLWQVACEFIAASRKLKSLGFSENDAWTHLQRFLGYWTLQVPGRSVLERARLLCSSGWAFWDALVVAGCLDGGITRLYSEDIPGRAAPIGLEIVNPFANVSHQPF